MSIDGSLQPSLAPRALRVLGLVATAAAVLLALAVAARLQIAEYLMANALRGAGLTKVAVDVTRLNAGGMTIGRLEAEGGALTVSQLEADFTILGLLGSRIDALAVEKAEATLTWESQGFKLGDFLLERQPDAGPLTLPDIGTLAAPNIALLINTPSASLRAPLSVTARTVPQGWDTAITGTVEGPGVAIGMDWAGVIASDDLARSAGRGRFDLNVAGFAIPGVTERVDAQGLVTLDAKDGVFAVAVNRALTFSFAAPAPIFERVPALQSLGALPWSVTIAPSHSEAALVVTNAGDQRRVRFDIAAAAQAGDGRMELAFAGELSRDVQTVASLQLANARIDVQDVPFGGGRISGQFAVSNFAGSLREAKGQIDATLGLDNVALEGMTVDQAQGVMSSTVQMADGAVTLAFRSLQTTLSRGALGSWALAAPAVFNLNPAAKAAQSVRINLASLDPAVDLAFALPELALQGRDDPSASLVVRAPDLRVASLKDSALGLSAANLSVSHTFADVMNGRIDLILDGGAISGKSTAVVARLGPKADDQPSGTTLAMSATLATRGDDLDLRGAFSTAAGAKLGDFTARVRRDMSRGSASFSLPRTRFERGGKVDAADLAFLAPVTDLTGTIGVEAKASWTGDDRTETAIATLEDVSFAVGDVSVAGLSTTIDLAALRPPRSTASHHVTVQSITAGLPLADLQADLAFPGDGTALVSKGSIAVAGGQITMADVTVPIDGHEGTFALGVQRIDMGQLAALAKVDGLSVTGTLSGSIPFRSDDAGFHFAEGALRADGPGKLVYKPATPPAALAQSGGGTLLLQALSNFSYDRLSLTLNGPVTEDISVGVALAGKNPDLYGGYPIEFNLTLSGRLTQILRQGLVGYGIPADIERQLREGKRPGP